jgi:hypothetical protein
LINPFYTREEGSENLNQLEFYFRISPDIALSKGRTCPILFYIAINYM